MYDDNDEIVLELFINWESSKGMVDISDSRGYSFFKDKENNLPWKYSLFGRMNGWFYKEYY